MRQALKARLPQSVSHPQYPPHFVCRVGSRRCHDGSDTLTLALLNWSSDRDVSILASTSIVAPCNTLLYSDRTLYAQV